MKSVRPTLASHFVSAFWFFASLQRANRRSVFWCMCHGTTIKLPLFDASIFPTLAWKRAVESKGKPRCLFPVCVWSDTISNNSLRLSSPARLRILEPKNVVLWNRILTIRPIWISLRAAATRGSARGSSAQHPQVHGNQRICETNSSMLNKRNEPYKFISKSYTANKVIKARGFMRVWLNRQQIKSRIPWEGRGSESQFKTQLFTWRIWDAQTSRQCQNRVLSSTVCPKEFADSCQRQRPKEMANWRTPSICPRVQPHEGQVGEHPDVARKIPQVTLKDQVLSECRQFHILSASWQKHLCAMFPSKLSRLFAGIQASQAECHLHNSELHDESGTKINSIVRVYDVLFSKRLLLVIS